jgi:hypothetical protein
MSKVYRRTGMAIRPAVKYDCPNPSRSSLRYRIFLRSQLSGGRGPMATSEHRRKLTSRAERIEERDSIIGDLRQ